LLEVLSRGPRAEIVVVDGYVWLGKEVAGPREFGRKLPGGLDCIRPRFDQFRPNHEEQEKATLINLSLAKLSSKPDHPLPKKFHLNFNRFDQSANR
jgi:hypothetical protein